MSNNQCPILNVEGGREATWTLSIEYWKFDISHPASIEYPPLEVAIDARATT